MKSHIFMLTQIIKIFFNQLINIEESLILLINLLNFTLWNSIFLNMVKLNISKLINQIINLYLNIQIPQKIIIKITIINMANITRIKRHIAHDVEWDYPQIEDQNKIN